MPNPSAAGPSVRRGAQLSADHDFLGGTDSNV